MVMEASPSPQSVGREFVRQYYTLLNKAPAHLHRFYNNYSSFVHGGLDAPNRETLPVVGQKQIHNRIQQLNFRDCHAKISQVDAQATLGNGVVVQVTGELSNGGAPMRRFTQTFVLAAQSPKKYYVHNDIFRYQDIVFSDEEGEGSGRSEGEDEEAGPAGAGGAAGYFPAPPPASAFPPAAFPAPPPAPHLNGLHALAGLAAPAGLAAQAGLAAPAGLAAQAGLAAPAGLAAQAGLSAPAPPVQPAPDDSTRHLVAALQAHSLSESEPEPAAAATPPAPAQVAGPAGPAGPGAAGPGAAGPGAAGPAGPEPGAAAPEPEPAPEPEREPSPPPHPPAAPEPKTYANLLKSGSGSAAAPARCSPPAAAPGPPPPGPAPAPHEARPRPPRAPHAALAHAPQHAQHAMPPPAEGARRYSDAQQLFLGNLPHCATEDELRALFARFGPVAELRVHSKPAQPGAPRHPNYGFITYETSQAAHDCLNAAPLYFPGASADGVKLNVEEKKARGREPPRRRPLSSHRAAFAPRQPYRR